MVSIPPTYNTFNLVRLVRVSSNSPVRLLALRMLQSPKGKVRPFQLLSEKEDY